MIAKITRNMPETTLYNFRCNNLNKWLFITKRAMEDIQNTSGSSVEVDDCPPTPEHMPPGSQTPPPQRVTGYTFKLINVKSPKILIPLFELSKHCMFFGPFLASLWRIWCHWQITSFVKFSIFYWPLMQEERKSRRDLGVLMVGHLLIPNTRVQYVWVTLTTSPWQTRVFTNSASRACWSGVRYFFY